MKNYEQKYKQALSRATFYNNELLTENQRKMLLDIFPELKESEDEKIKKAIHIYLDWLDGRKDYAPKGDYTIRDMIAWLEKQGNNKKLDANKVIEWMKTLYNLWPRATIDINELIGRFIKDFGI